MNRRVNVIGVGLTPFRLAGASGAGADSAVAVVRLALADAGIDFTLVGALYCAAAGAAPHAGQEAWRSLGLTGIPVFNLQSDGAGGASALLLARQAVETGAAECVLVLGVEPAMAHAASAEVALGNALHGAAAEEYLARYAARRESLAMLAVKAREHAARNPDALLRAPLSLEQVLLEPQTFGPLSASQCCTPAEGAAAVVLCSDAFARKRGNKRAVRIIAQAQCGELTAGACGETAIRAAGYDIAATAARLVYERAGLGPEEIDLCELQDATGSAELLLYEALGFCREGDAEKLIEDGDNTYGGNLVVNPSGGLLGRGHALGASGLAQCVELVRQLRGAADTRQVPGARHALQHSQGVQGDAVVTLYARD